MQAEHLYEHIYLFLWAASAFLTTHINCAAKEFKPIVAIPAGIPMQGQPMMAQPVMGAVVGQPLPGAGPAYGQPVQGVAAPVIANITPGQQQQQQQQQQQDTSPY